MKYDQNVPPDYRRLSLALLAWSKFHLRAKSKSPSWASARCLVEAAKHLDALARKHLEESLADSKAELEPLGEPLMLTLGEHRWLSADREESYSDWLAWILQGMPNSAEILPLFALPGEAEGEPTVSVGQIRREVSSEHGRTDIEVPLGERGLLIIEVKINDPGTELSGQLMRYHEKVVQLGVEHPLLVLLGIEAPDPSVLCGFTFTGWEVLCQRLRRYAKRVKESSDLLRAAAVLIFCGAVEQNLLGFSVKPRRFRAMATINYLRDWRKEV